MSMTVPQKKYFCKRIDEVTAVKISKVSDSELPEKRKIALNGIMNDKVKYPTMGEIREAIDKQLRRNNYNGDGSSYGYYQSSNCGSLDISSLLRGFKSYERRMLDNNELHNSEKNGKRNEILAEATRIKDVAMFGSEQEAHSMLGEFIKWQEK
mgnify:FL=1